MDGDYVDNIVHRDDGRIELVFFSDGGIYACSPISPNDLEDLTGSASIVLNYDQVLELTSELLDYLIIENKKRLGK